jgi:uncharacterized membrane protein (DUF485 family)
MLFMWIVLVLIIKYSSTWDDAKTMTVSWGFIFSVIPVVNVIIAGGMWVIATYTLIEALINKARGESNV